MNLEESIAHFAKITPDKAAVICGGETLSYFCLWERIRQRAKQLREQGLHERQPYPFVTTQDAEFIVTYCAVHLCGAVAVPVTSIIPPDSTRPQTLSDSRPSKSPLKGDFIFSPFKGESEGVFTLRLLYLTSEYEIPEPKVHCTVVLAS